LPRCQVSEGAHKAIYQWQGDAACTFLGGTKVAQKNFQCQNGESEQFQSVEVCVQGPAISGKGFDYETGQAIKVKGKYDFPEAFWSKTT
jgi:hypothetical protein